MKFSTVNLGCKVNSYEAESIASMLEEEGNIRQKDSKGSDVVVIFTCAVTNVAAQKSRQIIHRAKRENPYAIIVVAGCYSQIDPEAIGDVDILIGTANKTKIPELIHQFQKDGKPIRDIEKTDNLTFESMNTQKFLYQSRAYLKIQDGCNQFCAYCVIPYARGRERCMNPDSVILEAKRLSKNHKEIVLTGIHTGRYGKEYGLTLADMIERIINEVPELERIRISSIEISEIDDKLVSLMKSSDKVAKHFHIPLQSGCDTVLEKMGRPYTTKEFLDRIKEIRKAIPGISISTDLIVGFPQESEEEFIRTKEFLNECEFSFIHVFPYSLRDGTKAAQMDGQISPEEKKNRVNQCLNISEKLYDSYKHQYIGKIVDVLFERNKDGQSLGHSSEYLPVTVEGKYDSNTIAKVRITKMENHQLFGEVVI